MLLGSGTYGDVRGGWDDALGRMVAVKVFKKKDDNVCLLREVICLQIASPHPCIVKFIEFTKEGHDFQLKMEMMTCDLKRRCTLDSSSPVDFFSISSQLLAAVVHIHSLGFFHRDIKPQNILVNQESGRRDKVALADFGQARFMMQRGYCYTRCAGTLWYRSPEDMLSSNGKYDEKVDIWGVACTMHEVLQKRPTFPANTEVEMLTEISKFCGKDQFRGLRNSKFLPNFKKRAIATLNQEREASFLEKLFIVNPKKRPNAQMCLGFIEKTLASASSEQSKEGATSPFDLRVPLGQGGRNESGISPRNFNHSHKKLQPMQSRTPLNSSLLSWMQEMNCVLKLRLVTFFTAVDIFQAIHHVSGFDKEVLDCKELMLRGGVALWISSKVFEMATPEIADICFASRNIFSIEELESFEDSLIRRIDLSNIFCAHLDLEAKRLENKSFQIERFALSTSRLLHSAREMRTRDIIELCGGYGAHIRKRALKRGGHRNNYSHSIFTRRIREDKVLFALHSLCIASKLHLNFHLEKGFFLEQ